MIGANDRSTNAKLDQTILSCSPSVSPATNPFGRGYDVHETLDTNPQTAMLKSSELDGPEEKWHDILQMSIPDA
jgi:hypothetical protein